MHNLMNTLYVPRLTDLKLRQCHLLTSCICSVRPNMATLQQGISETLRFWCTSGIS